MGITNYNLANIPSDIGNFFYRPLAKDILALILCAIVYWGGTVYWMYLLIFVLEIKVIVVLWAAAIFFNVVIDMTPPSMKMARGLYYADKGLPLTQALFTITGPPGLFRTLALILFFVLRIKAKDTSLIFKSVKNWDSQTPWAMLLKEEAESYKSKSLKESIKNLWKMANKRIEII